VNTTEALRNLEVGDSYSVVRRVALSEYDKDEAQADLRKLNNNIGVIASRLGGQYVIERVFSLNNAQTHLLYGLVVTREA
jgi:hypothetical protein